LEDIILFISAGVDDEIEEEDEEEDEDDSPMLEDGVEDTKKLLTLDDDIKLELTEDVDALSVWDGRDI